MADMDNESSFFGDAWDNFKLGGAAIADAVLPDSLQQTFGIDDLSQKVYANQVAADPTKAGAGAAVTEKLANQTPEQRAEFAKKAGEVAEEKAGGDTGLAGKAAEMTLDQLAEKAKKATSLLRWGWWTIALLVGIALILVAWVASKVLPVIAAVYLPPPRKAA